MNTPLIVAYGLGVDSTAVLVRFQQLGIRPDLILFADTGNEKQETYDYLPVINEWLARVGFPTVTVVRNVVKNFKHWPPYETLGENCLTNGTLPSLAFGFKSCSLKWKVAPQNRYCSQWGPALEAWARGGKCRKVIGYDAGSNDLKRYAQAQGLEDGDYDYVYPLIEWGWDRDRCKAEIAAAGLPVPPKSACYFCPATQAAELHDFKKTYLRYIVIMEARARPRLEGHIPQEELDERYRVALLRWQSKCDQADAAKAAGRKGKATKRPTKPRRGVQAKGVLGLWRRGTKGTGKGKAKAAFKPGMMTDYIRSAGLLPTEEIDRLIANAPEEIISNQQAFAMGLEIPDWHDFIEAFTPETGLEESSGSGLLPVLRDPCAMCSACHEV
jgi:hypothetical protein